MRCCAGRGAQCNAALQLPLRDIETPRHIRSLPNVGGKEPFVGIQRCRHRVELQFGEAGNGVGFLQELPSGEFSPDTGLLTVYIK
jgi:hypothetical protein